jgi:hypothetical protein
MRLIYILIVSLLININCLKAQEKTPPLDKSPLDMSYCPNNYPILKVQDKLTDSLIARVIYSRPGKNGRAIFCDLVEYGKIWRLGANEATEIEFFKNVLINNIKVKKGRYTLYAIPNENKWTIIINNELNTWGSFMYNPKKDVARIDVPVETVQQITETFSIYFDLKNNSAQMNIIWDNVKVKLPFTVAKIK